MSALEELEVSGLQIEVDEGMVSPEKRRHGGIVLAVPAPQARRIVEPAARPGLDDQQRHDEVRDVEVPGQLFSGFLDREGAGAQGIAVGMEVVDPDDRADEAGHRRTLVEVPQRRIPAEEIVGDEAVLAFLGEPPGVIPRPVSPAFGLVGRIGVPVAVDGVGAGAEPRALLDHAGKRIGTNEVPEDRAAVVVEAPARLGDRGGEPVGPGLVNRVADRIDKGCKVHVHRSRQNARPRAS